MECSRTIPGPLFSTFRSNNTNKWNAQEQKVLKKAPDNRSNNTNKWNAQEPRKRRN